MRWTVLTLSLVCLAAPVARADEAEAVKYVEKLGGTVTRDANLPGNPVVAVDLSWRLPAGPRPVTDEGLKVLKHFKELRRLDLGGIEVNVTDAGLKEIKELRKLQTLSLAGTKVTDAGLKEIRELRELRTLYLS